MQSDSVSSSLVIVATKHTMADCWAAADHVMYGSKMETIYVMLTSLWSSGQSFKHYVYV